MADDIRTRLVSIALEWQDQFGVAPAITSAVSEYDASQLVKMPLEEYKSACSPRTAVARGYDFEYEGCKYQVKANRPSGKPRSTVTLVCKAKNFNWDKLIWILYDKNYIMQEAWEWTALEYRSQFEQAKRICPKQMQQGRRIHPAL